MPRMTFEASFTTELIGHSQECEPIHPPNAIMDNLPREMQWGHPIAHERRETTEFK